MGLLDSAKALLAARKFKQSTLGRALALHTDEHFYKGSALSDFSQANKDRLIGDFYGKIVSIGQADNAVMACRELLCEYVLSFAGLAVLCLKEEEKAAQVYASNPYISGTLWRHIEYAVAHNDEMAKLKWAHPESNAEELVAYANARSALMLYYANGLNMVRIELGDTDPQKDWYRPFVEATMVVDEDRQREKLGLVRLCPGSVGSLPYNLFLEFVINGSQNPFYEWTKAWPDRYLGGEGPQNPKGSSEDLDRYALQMGLAT